MSYFTRYNRLAKNDKYNNSYFYKIKQYLLGHATLEMTQNIYTDVQDDYVYSLSEKICNAI